MSIRTRCSIAALLLVAASGVACDREPKAPPAQAQTQTAQPLNTPATLTGCLRAGEAADTFVLTADATQTNEGTAPATYELAGSGGVNLQDHVGRRIEVTGVVSERRDVATSEPARPAAGDREKATGTAGTPTVQTGTQLSMRRIEVSSVRSAEGKCE